MWGECKHLNWNEKRWLADGCPMTHWECLDCGQVDCGHVYAEPVGWSGMTYLRDGKVVDDPRCDAEEEKQTILAAVGLAIVVIILLITGVLRLWP